MATSAPLSNSHRTFVALENPAFRLYMLGQIISVAGNWMQTVAQGWLVYQLTSSELWLGIVAFASGVPMLLISPWAGVLADRYSKRLVMMLGLTAEMILIASMAILSFADMIATIITICLYYSEPYASSHFSLSPIVVLFIGLLWHR